MKIPFLKSNMNISIGALLFCLMISLVIHVNPVNAEWKERTLDSAKDNGIIFTVIDFQYNDKNLEIYYRVKAEKMRKPKIGEFMAQPEILINGKDLHRGHNAYFRKVSENKYIGRAVVNLEEIPKKSFQVRFNTNVLLGQEGHWNVHFTIKQ